MFIRVKSKATGHEFDIHESRFDEGKYSRVDKRRYPPSRRPRRTKFKARISRAFSVVPAVPVVERSEDVSDDS